MKRIHLISLVGVAIAAKTVVGQDTNFQWHLDSALPLQAAVCDVAGVGHLVRQDRTNAFIEVDQLWLGQPTNNLDITSRALFPTNGSPFVFFATKYQSFLDLEPLQCRFSYIFDMDYHRSRYEPDSMYLLNGNRSWFPVTPENADMVNWCSNLVHVSQVNTNRQAFYELIRDGYRLNPESSRMHLDSRFTFMYFHYFNDTNFMKQVWSDTNLVGWARAEVNNAHFFETKTWLP